MLRSKYILNLSGNIRLIDNNRLVTNDLYHCINSRVVFEISLWTVLRLKAIEISLFYNHCFFFPITSKISQIMCVTLLR